MTLNFCQGHRWWQIRYPELMWGTRVQWDQAGGRDVTPSWRRVAGTDGTADVGRGDAELVPGGKVAQWRAQSGTGVSESWCMAAGAGGRAGDREVAPSQGRGGHLVAGR